MVDDYRVWDVLDATVQYLILSGAFLLFVVWLVYSITRYDRSRRTW